MRLNPKKAMNKLLESEKFLEEIGKKKEIEDAFVDLLVGLEKGDKIPAKMMDALFDNDTFYKILTKLDPATQEKVVNHMIKFGDNAYVVMNTGEKVLDGASTATSATKGSSKFIAKAGKFGIKIGSGLDKVKNSRVVGGLGKASTVLSAVYYGSTYGFSTYDSYNDKESGAYKDLGKASTGGVIDVISTVGPIDGALIGASVGGPVGAFGGLLAGIGLASLKANDPDWTTGYKEDVYVVMDDADKYATDEYISQWGGQPIGQ